MDASRKEKLVEEKKQGLQHPFELLQDIVVGLRGMEDYRLSVIKVYFWHGNMSFEFDLHSALDMIANDIFWDERGNWSEADRATVETF